MAALAHPLIQLWVGGEPDITPEIVDRTALTVQMMSVALTARGISDGWTMILRGVPARLCAAGAGGGDVQPRDHVGHAVVDPPGADRTECRVLCQPDCVQRGVHDGSLRDPARRRRTLPEGAYPDVFAPLTRPLVATVATAVVVGPLVWAGVAGVSELERVDDRGDAGVVRGGVWGGGGMVGVSRRSGNDFIWPLLARDSARVGRRVATGPFGFQSPLKRYELVPSFAHTKGR